ncbi:hypothetical protein QVD17_05079 [Tagetes erecta]|uniref:Uncharacterized protein n=1 Tax=Tagetes erecta TaxID=13708 RepID=A0AAD8PA86_TARER|nr:hypothetical protein QVD17_05079 [Tagetes erecta]
MPGGGAVGVKKVKKEAVKKKTQRKSRFKMVVIHGGFLNKGGGLRSGGGNSCRRSKDRQPSVALKARNSHMQADGHTDPGISNCQTPLLLREAK